MRYNYILRIANAARAEVAHVLGRESSDDTREWNWFLDQRADDEPIPFVDVFMNLLEGRFTCLERLGVTRNDITVWLLYEYDEQCNLELSAQDMRRLGEAGVTLCMSCWQSRSDETR